MDASRREDVRIPRWVTAMDVLCLVLSALMIRALLGDGFRISIGAGMFLSLRSWHRLALWIAVLLAARHYWYRAVPWHARVLRWIQAVVNWPPIRAAWPPFALSRALVLIAGYVAVFTIGFKETRGRAVPNDFLDLYARFDGAWYHAIASIGYADAGTFDPKEQNAIAFFPGLPLMMRAVSMVLDVNLWAAGVTIVILAFLWGLTYVYRLARLDLPEEESRVALMLLALYPFGMCYSALLTESVFLLAAAASFYHFRREEYLRGGPFALALGFLRPNGFLVAVPLALIVLLPFARSRGWLPGSAGPPVSWTRLASTLALAALPVVGLICYAAYINSVTGDPFAFLKAQQAWGRGKAELFTVIADRRRMIANEGLTMYLRTFPIEMIESAAAIMALAAVVPIIRRFGLAYGTFVAMAVLPPFITMGSISLGRYTAPLFPIFLWLAAAIPSRQRTYWFVAFAFGQALLSALFFTSRPPY
jgi:hypothetical protein